MITKNKRFYFTFFFITIIFLFSVYLYLSYNNGYKNIKILKLIRIPRLLIGVLTGSSLAIVGAIYQAIFKNPLAEPYLLGTSSGAAIGSLIVYYFNLNNLLFLKNFSFFAFAFFSAFLSIFFVLYLSRFKKNRNIYSLILSGVVFNIFAYSIAFLIIASDYNRLHNIFLWLWGKLPVLNYTLIFILFFIFIIIFFYFLASARTLNLYSISTEFAESKGIDTKKVTINLLIASTILISISVSFCGIIGFVGLIIPHIVRIILKEYDIKKILFIAPITGSIFVLISDIAGKTLFYPRLIPIGIFTSLIGAPIFFYLIHYKRNNPEFH